MLRRAKKDATLKSTDARDEVVTVEVSPLQFHHAFEENFIIPDGFVQVVTPDAAEQGKQQQLKKPNYDEPEHKQQPMKLNAKTKQLEEDKLEPASPGAAASVPATADEDDALVADTLPQPPSHQQHASSIMHTATLVALPYTTEGKKTTVSNTNAPTAATAAVTQRLNRKQKNPAKVLHDSTSDDDDGEHEADTAHGPYDQDVGEYRPPGGRRPRRSTKYQETQQPRRQQPPRARGTGTRAGGIAVKLDAQTDMNVVRDDDMMDEETENITSNIHNPDGSLSLKRSSAKALTTEKSRRHRQVKQPQMEKPTTTKKVVKAAAEADEKEIGEDVAIITVEKEAQPTTVKKDEELEMPVRRHAKRKRRSEQEQAFKKETNNW
jgi:hypothetical protein